MSDLVGNQIVGFLMHRLIYDIGLVHNEVHQMHMMGKDHIHGTRNMN